MNFSINVICKNELVAETSIRLEKLLISLGISAKPQFEKYWKDSNFSQVLFGATLQNPNFNYLKAELAEIAGTEVSFSGSMEAWEFSSYASPEELLLGKKASFLVCEIY